MIRPHSIRSGWKRTSQGMPHGHPLFYSEQTVASYHEARM